MNLVFFMVLIVTACLNYLAPLTLVLTVTACLDYLAPWLVVLTVTACLDYLTPLQRRGHLLGITTRVLSHVRPLRGGRRECLLGT